MTKLRCKQEFLETVMVENESLKKALQSVQGEPVAEVSDLKRELGRAVKGRAEIEGIREVMDRTWDDDDEIEKLTEELRAVKRGRSRLREKSTQSQDVAEANGCEDDGQDENLRAQIEKLSEELRAARKDKDRPQHELTQPKDANETTTERLDGVRQQLSELQDTLSAVTKERDQWKASCDELQTEHQLMQSALAGYEGDFKKEREEKVKALDNRKKLETRLKEVTEKHDRIQKDYSSLRQRLQTTYSQAKARWNPPAPPTYKSVTDADGLQVSSAASPGRSPSRVNELQCPDCKKMFPCHLLEDHMRSCAE